jgi:hypothetical protein
MWGRNLLKSIENMSTKNGCIEERPFITVTDASFVAIVNMKDALQQGPHLRQ